MARVHGVKEQLQFPLYDAFFVPPGRSFGEAMREATTDERLLEFFKNVQNKTKLETNLKISGKLPCHDRFEARAMRVVVSAPLVEVVPGEEDDCCLKFVGATVNYLALLIYTSVVSLFIENKTMIEMPTFWFPAGAGVSPGSFLSMNHGEPDPMATFRFAEPVIIDPLQSFRVEMLFPRGVNDKIKDVTGPLHVWTVLDGYLVRDVQ